MPDDRKKMYSKQSTGTVPKSKHRNNTAFTNHDNFQRSLSNNLGLDGQRQDYSNYSRNSDRNFSHLLPYMMDASFVDRSQNPTSQINLSAPTANGTLSTSSTSGSNSRRESVGTIPKCDNVKKCPDKKQIEDKLNQIREYLQVTTSLMSSIKNEDQSAINELENFKKMIKDLKDSEAKLLALLDDPLYDESSDPPSLANVQEHLENGVDNGSEISSSGYQRNELEEKVEFTNRKVQLLREQQNALINLKRKAENQLRDARQAQENLMLMQQQQKNENRLQNLELDHEQGIGNEIFAGDKNLNENQFDIAIKELEHRLDSMRNDSRQAAANAQDHSLDYLQEQLHLLDNHDSQLNSEHIELQQKLNDLQGKKMQIDRLAEQLQNLGDDDEEDIGNQVRKIVTMKQQLSSLKDLLEVVKNTEYSLLDSQNVNGLELEPPEPIQSGSVKRDNIRQNVMINHNQNDRPRVDNNRARVNEQWPIEKQSNKSIVNIKEREKVLAELKSKKRELEEIMYKQKDSTSINNDVCSESSVNKSDVGANNVYDNVVMSWLPVHPYQHNQVASLYSSDECAEEDINEYSELNYTTEPPMGTVPPPPQPVLSSNYTTAFPKRSDTNQSLDSRCTRSSARRSSSRTREPCVPSISTTTPMEQEQPLPNCSMQTDSTKAQLQKQLELIQCVCQSLLDQQASNSSNLSNVQHLRNNLTPSSLYSEPKRYSSGNLRQSTASLNMDLPYFNNPNTSNHYAFGEAANNQNMLAANTLQTQAFLLNTLNQCCQMLWFQQREIATLRSMICSMQDQLMHGQNETDINSVPLPPTSFVLPTRPASSMSNFRPSQPRSANPKVNHVSSACSLPNLNPPTLHANADNAYLTQNNIRSSPSARLLESSLNNTAPIHSHLNLSGDSPANNTLLPNVNTGIVQPLPSQIWNGQALNNQVPPGNRANNYWDNFRSYSRQNLLSTSSKSNEGLQNTATSSLTVDSRNTTTENRNSILESRNSTVENRNSAVDRTRTIHSSPLQPFSPKLNMVHNESANTSEEGTPRRVRLNKPVASIPPDVLNVNHNSNQKRNETPNATAAVALDLHLPENNLQQDGNNSPHDRNLYTSTSHRNRNEWHNNEQSERLPNFRSKLFEELRENVYKEVANLISANESRPHFLIQLFRDLQQVNSDALRGRTLQSIQTLLTNALETMRGGAGGRQEAMQGDSDEFPLAQPLWAQLLSAQSNSNELGNNEDPDIHNILKMTFSFLTLHQDEVLQTELMLLLKDFIMKAIPFTQIFANINLQERTFHTHFMGILNEAFEKYQGRRVAEVKKDLLKTISDVLVEEFSFIYLVKENVADNCENVTHQCNNPPIHDGQLSLNLQCQPMVQIIEEGNTPQMQNGDLAEADQSHLELLDEEGAVGGAVSPIVGPSSLNLSALENVEDVNDMEFAANVESEIEFVEQGLDQVPTRLTGSRPHSSTPSRDRSNTSRSDHSDHF
ncbi:pericentriolar material 1 protein isoform X4 [Photinus pyralis]|uniref:pericentriolar material 1 protein isoform X4 n=1 Tax=Photinus pyralis TaxID=7054 RepID=UPI0012675648|nr:pericentriolar material 1 protein isoform X4 [Photinus pyralis]